jgi:hypothetical protein
VQFTGQWVDLAEHTWLDGPIGEPSGIGSEYFYEFARKHKLEIQPGTGLLDNFEKLRAPAFDPSKIASPVIDFYVCTSKYVLDAWSDWRSAFRPFGSLLALLFSRRLQQLNVPLNPLDTSRGLSSEILRVIDPVSGELYFTAWLRLLLGTGDVLYAGAYSTCRIPHYDGECVKVVFPLPNGNAIVIMRPVVHEDGSLSVISHGEHFGDPGFYFTVHSARGVRARYLRSLRETIRVYPDGENIIRADHQLSLWGITFLRLHYRLTPKAASVLVAGGHNPATSINAL